MDFKGAYVRALRGVREDVRLYLVAISSLTVAFLCLGGALLGVANLTALSERWGRSDRMSIYLRDDAPEVDVSRLTMALQEHPAVAKANYNSAEVSRARFLDGNSALRDLPRSAFPATIELELKPNAHPKALTQIAESVAAQRSVVEEVDTYRSWFERIAALIGAGRTLVIVLASLVLACVMAIVANTIRLAVASRREEIEVLKMCGATNAFVRAPFVLEGTAQGLCAALLSLGVLALAFFALRAEVGGALRSFLDMQPVFLSPLVMLGLLVAGGAVGAAGSALSVRRYIRV
ncbi:MAG TPA: FtsX-like permease family protein [Polyangiales bacterium]|nr:FtsX-like permease family protein [Polyangiales bacterium]